MSKKDDSGPAFPGEVDEVFVDSTGEREPFKIARRQKGMTLRDYFAAKAMQALLGEMAVVGTTAKQHGEHPKALLVAAAYEFADAMLAERSKA